ncbi:MAG: carboxylate-amine ligase [Anaerolineales bacterium]|nr:carboxylate-amine ligase [Anaerolineales bacterium]MCB9128993.1 carboxylate-amine ligase [Ardenticatenales bacterium]
MLKAPSLTIGIEEEYQIIDPETRQLKSYITQFLDGEHTILRERELKPELIQSMVELGTQVCNNVQEARDELVKMRCLINDLARSKGLAIVASGTHPLSHWQDQEITPFERYMGVLEDMQDLARQLLIFGMHVHIGIEDPEFAIDVMNVSRYMLPHLLALSTSSPFWEGRNTGLKSYRSVIFRRFPRTGIPFTFNSSAAFDEYVQILVDTGSIPDGSKIWWDARPHHLYPTIEFRGCDLCTRVDDAIAIAAILQSLVLKLWKMRMSNTTFRQYPPGLIDENKWRAVRYGIDGKLIDFGRRTELPARQLITELVEFVAEEAEELGCLTEVEHVFNILDHGTSADRQIAVFEETGSVEAVVDMLIEDTLMGCYRDDGSPNA